VGIDLDHCRDPQTGEITPRALEIVQRLDSYTEISPSGDGLHILVIGQLPRQGNKCGGIEMYSSGRYFTVTGQHLPGTPTTIEERQAELTALYQEVFGESSERRSPHRAIKPVQLPDELPQVALDSLFVSDEMKELIRIGVPRGKRSEAVAKVECALIGTGYDDAIVAAVLLNPEHGVSEKPLEQGWGWLAADIARARERVEREQAVQEVERIVSEPEPEPEQANSPFRTLKQRRANRQQTSHPEPILEKYIIPGAITLLAGDPKAGKSTLLTGLLKALETGGEFCGLKVQPTRVVYLSEDPERAMDQRFQDFGLDPDRVSLLAVEDTFSLDNWEARIDAAIAAAQLTSAECIVIDTFGHWSDLEEKQAWDEAVVTRRMKYLRKATALGYSVVVVVHFGRNGRIRGSTAFEGSVDIVSEFKTDRRRADTQRVLTLKPRGGYGIPEQRVIDLDLDTWTYNVVTEQPAGHRTAKNPAQSGHQLTKTSATTAASTGDRLWALIPIDSTCTPIDSTCTLPGPSQADLKQTYEQQYGQSINSSTISRTLTRLGKTRPLLKHGQPRSKTNPERYWRAA